MKKQAPSATREAAEALGICVRTAQLWVEQGRLRAWKTPGGHRRILRESVSNIIRHAQASRVEVQLQWADGVLHLHVIDDGIATSTSLQRDGRGSRNMLARAHAMGGEFERFARSPSGCHVHVSLPITLAA